MNPGIDITHAHGSNERASRLFVSQFGVLPWVVARAPGRVNMLGDHIDYCGGLVLPRTLRHTTSVAIGPCDSSDDDGIVAVSEAFVGDVQRAHWKNLAPGSVHGWFAYVAGTLAVLSGDASTALIPRMPVRIAVASDVPVGAGLSSSAALEVATARAAIEYARENDRLGDADNIINEHKISAAARRAEHTYAGVPCGIMDQLVCAAGRDGYCTAIDCQTENITHLPWPDHIGVVVVDSGVKHQLVDGEYAKRRSACESALAKIRECYTGVTNLCETDVITLKGKPPQSLTSDEYAAWKHTTTEHLLAKKVVELLSLNNGRTDSNDKQIGLALGELFVKSHESLSRTYRVSCDEVDVLIDKAMALPGVYGARMTGGGFGGCIVLICDASRCEQVLRSMLMFNVPRGFVLT